MNRKAREGSKELIAKIAKEAKQINREAAKIRKEDLIAKAAEIAKIYEGWQSMSPIQWTTNRALISKSFLCPLRVLCDSSPLPP